jgi:hypothetical protein
MKSASIPGHTLDKHSHRTATRKSVHREAKSRQQGQIDPSGADKRVERKRSYQKGSGHKVGLPFNGLRRLQFWGAGRSGWESVRVKCFNSHVGLSPEGESHSKKDSI